LAHYTSRGNGCFAYRLSQSGKRSDVYGPYWNLHANTPADGYGYSHAPADRHCYRHAQANRNCHAKAYRDCHAQADRDCHAQADRDCHPKTDSYTNSNGCAQQHQHSLVCADR
jgi:hypothetical protein